MTAISDDDLLSIAPNVVVQVGTPPPVPDFPFDKERIPRYLFSIVGIETKKTQKIGNDQTQDLVNKVKKGSPPTPPSEFLLKAYGLATTKPVSVPDPDVDPPTIDPPLPPGTAPKKTTKTTVPDVPKNLPFQEIAYSVKDLLPDPFVKDRTGQGAGIDAGTTKKFKSFPSSVYVNAIGSCISTPYYRGEAYREFNGVLGDQRTNSNFATYYWEWWQNPVPAGIQVNESFLTPRPDGIINITPQYRGFAIPTPGAPPQEPVPVTESRAYLDPGKWEDRKGIYNGKSLNAFSLILGITTGGGGETAVTEPWVITIQFGDLSIQIFQDNPEITVGIKGMEPPEKIPVQPSSASHLTESFGGRPYVLTFIPVWNGLLISDGLPGSSDWGSNIKFIAKNKNLDINKGIDKIVNPPPNSEDDTTPPPRPPKTIIKRNSVLKQPGKVDGKPYLRKFKAPGIRVSQGNDQINFGTRLMISYRNCGGAFQFKPVYFPQFSRYHLLGAGAAHQDDLKTSSSGSTVRVPLNPNVFKIKSKSSAVILPIFSYESEQYIDFRANLATIIKDKAKPWSCVSMEFQAHNPDLRRPMQVWGLMTQDESMWGPGSIEQPPVNEDGVLSADAISVERIRSFNISKGFDGSSGDIVWDRYNPITQQLDPRPYQRVGGIQVALTGGANTVPGVVFTGIAYGNSEENNPGENLIRIPIKGRESKLTGEGGLGLVNVPFFDGYDHRDAMLYMANYGGFPIDISRTYPFRLISSYNIQSPILDFPVGTAVLQAMDTIATSASTFFYFDRLGTLIYISQEKSTGRNWDYPDLVLESFSDEPDHTWVRNMIIIIALVAGPVANQTLNVDFSTVPTQAVMIRIPLTTYPEFAWEKMAVYSIQQVVRDVEELMRQAVQISKGQSRPRSTARCRIPGNAQIELADTINGKWYVTSVSQQADTQRKTWSTELGVEMIRPDIVEPVGWEILPISDMDI